MQELAHLNKTQSLAQVLECINILFPFHLVLDRELRFVQLGKNISKLDKDCQLGNQLQNIFAIEHPFITPSFDKMIDTTKRTFIFSFLKTGIKLKGQMVRYKEEGILIFAGTPVISDGKSILNFDLILSDFAPYDALPDFLFNLNALENSYREIKHLVNDLNQNKLKLMRSNEELNKFAYVASHDLQSPLRSIVSFSQLLKKRYSSVLDDTAHEYLQFIISATKRMEGLIKGLLEYSKVQNQSIVFKEIDLNKLLKNIIDDNIFEIKKQDAVINYSSLPSIIGNPLFIGQLFQNLISNAVKFRKLDTPPTIDIRFLEKENHWKFSVSDNGIGFNMEEGKKIFEIFQRVVDPNSFEGTGIGLAVCKKIVENHQGEIWVESQVNQGSIFHFTISKNLG